jgi:hypothetical protein
MYVKNNKIMKRIGGNDHETKNETTSAASQQILNKQIHAGVTE